MDAPSLYVGGHSGGHRIKFHKILEDNRKRKVPGTLDFTRFSELFGGDNRDRTGDLLNAIQRKVVAVQRFLGYLVVTWWSQKPNNF